MPGSASCKRSGCLVRQKVGVLDKEEVLRREVLGVDLGQVAAPAVERLPGLDEMLGEGVFGVGCAFSQGEAVRPYIVGDARRAAQLEYPVWIGRRRDGGWGRARGLGGCIPGGPGRGRWIGRTPMPYRSCSDDSSRASRFSPGPLYSSGGIAMNSLARRVGFPANLRKELICPTWVRASAMGPLSMCQKGRPSMVTALNSASLRAAK